MDTDKIITKIARAYKAKSLMRKGKLFSLTCVKIDTIIYTT